MTMESLRTTIVLEKELYRRLKDWPWSRTRHSKRLSSEPSEPISEGTNRERRKAKGDALEFILGKSVAA